MEDEIISTPTDKNINGMPRHSSMRDTGKPQIVAGLRFVQVVALTTGLGYRVRAFTVFQREQAGLFAGPSALDP